MLDIWIDFDPSALILQQRPRIRCPSATTEMIFALSMQNVSLEKQSASSNAHYARPDATHEDHEEGGQQYGL
jgi:hypothetical protein